MVLSCNGSARSPDYQLVSLASHNTSEDTLPVIFGEVPPSHHGADAVDIS